MLTKKKIALFATILMATLAVGVYAGMRLSNILETYWTVVENQDNLVLTWSGAPSPMKRGYWYGNDWGLWIKLENVGTATYHVIVKWRIWTADSALPENCIRIEYWDGDSWEPVGFYGGWGTSEITGYYGPPSGFDCTPGWNQITYLRIMFDGNAPLTNYGVQVWVEEA